MARPRACRHDIRCPHCGGQWMPKDGTIPQGRQTYRCRECNRRCQPDAAYHRPGPAFKEPALAMYCEGGSCRAIGRILGVSGQLVSNWVKKGRAPY